MTEPLLLQVPLHALHLELGARMVPFAGYAMPVQYPSGIVAEHRQCREAAALFDVSHMGQIRLLGAHADHALESLIPMDVVGLPVGKQRYAFFTNDAGGILDDLMITRRPHDLLLIVNAGCKNQDLDHLRQLIAAHCEILPLPEQALLAFQGPQAARVMQRLAPSVTNLTFMTGSDFQIQGIDCFITRSGYTGEDGFEISVHQTQAEALARLLLAQPEVQPCGLGARDTLRLEAGLCLYGHDITPLTTPVEAQLTWAIQKIRRPGGERAGGYPGAALIESQLQKGPDRLRVGLMARERAPVREGSLLFVGDAEAVGQVTSGTFAPGVQQSIALGYVPLACAAPGTAIQAEVRGRKIAMQVTSLPFAPHRYFRK